MKTTILWVTIALGAVVTTTGGWYWYNSLVATVKSVLVDVTDISKLSFKADELVKALTNTEDTYGTTIISLQAITNVDYNKKFVAELPASFPLLVNPDEREKEVSEFGKRVDSNLALILKDTLGRKQSSIYLPIIREANRLALLPQQHKELSVLSDLGENSDCFSVYRYQDLLTLERHPEKVQQLFDALQKTNDLHGLIVNLVFQPKNSSDNRIFTLMSKLLASQLEAKGAVVNIGANITTCK